jgi:hypothetical protein
MWMAFVLALGCAAGDKDGGDGPGDDTGGGGDDGGMSSTCPDEVPDAYIYTWNCAATGCEGGRQVYHHGLGASEPDGSFSVTEDWFMFWDGGDSHCIETFEITGTLSGLDGEQLNCSGCEVLYEAEWTMLTNNECGLNWGSVFQDLDDESNLVGPFEGYVMLDTHNAFGGRNEDNGMLVFSAINVSGNSYLLDSSYGRGTATPTSEEDGPPEDYAWASTGACWTMSR